MSEIKKYINWIPLHGSEFQPYLRPATKPPLDTGGLDLQAIDDNNRMELNTPTNGDLTLGLFYKGREGAFASVEPRANERDLEIVQLQGAKQNGYRLTVGMDWPRFFYDQIAQIVMHPDLPFERLTMPPPLHIEGISETLKIGPAIHKYAAFIAVAGLAFSREENLYVKEVRPIDH